MWQVMNKKVIENEKKLSLGCIAVASLRTFSWREMLLGFSSYITVPFGSVDCGVIHWN